MSDIITDYRLKERQRLAELTINIMHEIERDLITMVSDYDGPSWIMPRESEIEKLNAVFKELRETL